MKAKLLIATLLFTLLMPFSLALAAATTDSSASDITTNLDSVASTAGLSGNADIKVIIGNVIKIFLGFLGIIAVILIIWAGFTWMTAMGDAGKVDKAKKIITQAVVGLVIIIIAYSITSYVVSQVKTLGGGSTTTTTSGSGT